MQQELKNCPFCGGTELTYINHRRCIRCKSCDAEGPYEPTGTEDNLWNTRADKAVPDGWQDISTAPRDGTHIIVFRPVYDGQYIPQVGVDYFKKWSAEPNGSWMKSRADCQPTHWMPFPQPPKEGD